MRDPWEGFDAQVRSLVRRVWPESADEPAIERPPNDLADLAVPCFPLAKLLCKAPAAIAQELSTRLMAMLPAPGLRSVEAVGGYLNFHADHHAIAAAVLAQSRQADALASVPWRKKRVILEHTSANPNGPLHVGRARNPILGDTVARILRAAGWEVETQYYVDDLGKQVATLAWGIANADSGAMEPPERTKADHDLVRYYQSASTAARQRPEVAHEIQQMVKRSEEADPETLRRFETAYQPVLDGMIESMSRIGVTFDRYVKESNFVANGDTGRVIAALDASEMAGTDPDGGRYLDLKGHGIAGRSQRFVYQRRDGTSLYATRDVAYHAWKAANADRLVNVLGEDHKLQSRQVEIALQIVESPHTPEVIFYSFVSLPEGKMSTRRGLVVYLDDLIDEAVARAYDEVKRRRAGELDDATMLAIAEAVGVGALRFNIIRVQPEKPIQFQWEEALNFEGDSGPFIQYAYARLASIRRKAPETPDASTAGATTPGHPAATALLLALGRFPGVVEDAAAADRPHLVAVYAQELAAQANAFYRDCPVLSESDDAKRSQLLAVVDAACAGLSATMDLLGLPVLETM